MKAYRILFLLITVCVCMSVRAQESVQHPQDTVDGQIYSLYTVERGIGLYRISKNFGVSQELILKANPDLQRRGLHYGEVIRIPIGEVQTEMPVQVVAQPLEESSAPIAPIETAIELQEEDTMLYESYADIHVGDSVIRLAIMLPLHAEAVTRTKTMDRFYDFYAGALLAINEVQKQGQKIELFTYDVGKTSQKITQLLCDSTWPKVDAIIGPAYAGQVTVAAEYAKRDSTWLLIPFLSNIAEIEDNPYVLKFNPSATAEIDTLVNYLLSYKDSINCVLLESKDGENIPQSITQLHSALKDNEIPTQTISLRSILVDSLDVAFVEGKENIVIFNTEKYSNLSVVMPHLLKGYSKYRITLYSHYSWKNEKIILPQIYTSIFKEAYVVPEEYTAIYQAYFGHAPAGDLPRYDLLGYDVTLHLLRMLQSDNVPADDTWWGVQANIHYQTVGPMGGYENKKIHVVRK